MNHDQPLPHSSHWGAFSVVRRGDGIEIVPHPRDPDPAVLLGNLPAALTHRARIATPMVRLGWLDRGPGPDERRGRDEFVALGWTEALDLAACELRRVYEAHGSGAVFGGSYGWSSAGRFHHAQSQVHRFLNVPVWMGVVLAAMLGQIGLPGGGFVYGMGSVANIGKPMLAVPLPTLPQGRNAEPGLIPVARIADLLLCPGQPYDFNGRRLVYPDIRLVYWAGGNPFHHHQDLNRLRRAFTRPDTVIVHESAWTATARHADIVFPATVTLERADIGGSANDPLLVAMHPAAAPFGQARDDYAIFSDLAARLGVADRFTEGRSAWEWLRHLYEPTRMAMGSDALDFDAFWAAGEVVLPTLPWDGGLVRAFRTDPDKRMLPTASGLVEISCGTIGGFGYADCLGHPAWLPPVEGAGDAAFPLQLVANQPATRLHSQLDFGAVSLGSKVQGREPVRINPADAAVRGILDGDVVRVFNRRGACLAGAVISEAVRPGVVQLATGAWYDPLDPGADDPLCVHGNPNVLTRDAGTSQLAQACTGQLTIVEVERFAGALPPVRAFDPPGGG